MSPFHRGIIGVDTWSARSRVGTQRAGTPGSPGRQRGLLATNNRSGEPNKLFPPSGCFFALHPEDLDQESGQVLGRLCLRCGNPSLPELRSHLLPVSISFHSHFHIRGIRRGVFPQHDSEFDIDDNGRRRNKPDHAQPASCRDHKVSRDSGKDRGGTLGKFLISISADTLQRTLPKQKTVIFDLLNTRATREKGKHWYYAG